MKQIEQFINEKLVINKNIKLDNSKYHIETEDELKDKLKDILTTINKDNHKFQEYKDIADKTILQNSIVLKSVDKLIDYLISDKKRCNYFAMSDLFIMIMCEDKQFSTSKVFRKWGDDPKFKQEIIDYCADIALNLPLY